MLSSFLVAWRVFYHRRGVCMSRSLFEREGGSCPRACALTHVGLSCARGGGETLVCCLLFGILLQ